MEHPANINVTTTSKKTVVNLDVESAIQKRTDEIARMQQEIDDLQKELSTKQSPAQLRTAMTISKNISYNDSVVSQPVEVSECFNFTAAEPARVAEVSAAQPVVSKQPSVHAQRGNTTSHAVVEEESIPQANTHVKYELSTTQPKVTK